MHHGYENQRGCRRDQGGDKPLFNMVERA